MKRNQTKPTEAFSFSEAPSYADKSEYVEKALQFTLMAVELQQGRGFDGSDRWVLTVEPNDGRGKQLVTFACNEKRDPELTAAKEHIEKRGPLLNVRLHRSGKAYYLRNNL